MHLPGDREGIGGRQRGMLLFSRVCMPALLSQ